MAEFNLEAKIEEQANKEGKVQTSAVEKAKESIAERKAAEEARQVEMRLTQAERIETDALKALRFARAKESAQKKYLTDLNAAKAAFEASGDYHTYDDTCRKAEKERNKSIDDAKTKIYGDESWRY